MQERYLAGSHATHVGGLRPADFIAHSENADLDAVPSGSEINRLKKHLEKMAVAKPPVASLVGCSRPGHRLVSFRLGEAGRGNVDGHQVSEAVCQHEQLASAQLPKG